MTMVYKNNLNRNKKMNLLDDLCGYLGSRNCVSMRKQGTCCIAPKLCGAHIEGSKTPKGAD